MCNVITYDGPDLYFVLSAMREAIYLHGVVTLEDFRKLTGDIVEPDDHEYVWTEMMLDDYVIEKNVYTSHDILKLPKPARKVELR